jgi:hypothetical protein
MQCVDQRHEKSRRARAVFCQWHRPARISTEATWRPPADRSELRRQRGTWQRTTGGHAIDVFVVYAKQLT